MMNKVRLVKVICMILISTKAIFGQPVSTDAVSYDIFNPTTNDSIQYLNIPERSEKAINGSEFANQVTSLSISDREKAIVREILSGNTPPFARKLKPLKIIKQKITLL